MAINTWPDSPAMREALLLLLLLLVLPTSNALGLSYCSSQNTADSGPSNYQYQSNGHCQDTCKAQYAFAVLKGNDCWCSNYIPANTGSNDDCNINCPGFPFEKCGNPDKNLYGYFQLDIEPSGTAGVPSSAAPSTPEITPSTTSQPPTSSPPPRPSTSTTSTTSTKQSTWSPSPYPSVKTVLGSIQTIIVTPTSPPLPVGTNTTIVNAPATASFWSEPGKVAGVFIAVALILVGLIAAAMWFMIRRMKQRNEAMMVGSTADDEHGLKEGGHSYMTDRRRSNLTLATAGLTRGNSNEKSTADNTPASLSRRTSIPLVHDQRLNPVALWNSAHENGSHVSFASFQDDRDYSRPVLHIRNPDAQ